MIQIADTHCKNEISNNDHFVSIWWIKGWLLKGKNNFSNCKLGIRKTRNFFPFKNWLWIDAIAVTAVVVAVVVDVVVLSDVVVGVESLVRGGNVDR